MDPAGADAANAAAGIAGTDEDDFVDGVDDLVHAEAIYSVQRMADVLSEGPDPEREFVLFELQQLLDHCRQDVMDVLVPVLCEQCVLWPVDLQFRAAEALVRVVAVVLRPDVAWMITIAAYRLVDETETRVPEPADRNTFYELWGGVINDALLQVSLDDQQAASIIQIVDAGLTSPVPARRKLAARVTGCLAQTFSSTQVFEMLLPRSTKLANDPDVQVRGTVAESLAFVGAKLPVMVTVADLWPILTIFLEDSDARVKATTLRTISHILTEKKENERNEKLFKDLLQPILLQWANFAKLWAQEDQRMVDDDTYLLLEVVAEVFGNLVHSVSLYSKLGFRKQAIRAYAAMATCNGPLIRRNCSYNMPGIALTLTGKYGSELTNIVEQFSRDSDDDVRAILAAGMHETVSKLVNTGRIEKLIAGVSNLLQDDNAMVRLFILEHFAETLGALVKEGDPSAMRRLTPVLEHVRFLSQGDWHTQEQFAQQLGDAVHLIPPSLLREKVLPLLLELTETGKQPVRVAAVHSTIRCFRYFRNPTERAEAVERFWGRLAGGNHTHRLCLLEGGLYSAQCFSVSLFKMHFSSLIFSMAKDPVSNVRLKLASMLPELATFCEQSPEFIRAYHTLAKDRDPDVRYAITLHNRKAGKLMQKAKEWDQKERAKVAAEEKLYNLKFKSQGLQGLTQAADQVKAKMENVRAQKGSLSAALKRTTSKGSRGESETNSIPECDSDDSDLQKPASRKSSLKDTISDIASNLIPGSRKTCSGSLQTP